MTITIKEADNRELTFKTIAEAKDYLTSLTTLWTFTHLGGYELMRDGTKTEECESHLDALYFLEDFEIFESYSSEELHSLFFNDFQSDESVYEFISKWYSDRYDDGGGWGEVECSDVTGLLPAIREYYLTIHEKD